MTETPANELRGRELEAMRLLQSAREATVEELRRGLAGSLSASAVRTILARLVEKGHVRVGTRDGRNVYRPKPPSTAARQTAVDRVVTTYFEGSALSAALTLLDGAAAAESVDPAVRQRLEQLVEELKVRESGG